VYIYYRCINIYLSTHIGYNIGEELEREIAFEKPAARRGAIMQMLHPPTVCAYAKQSLCARRSRDYPTLSLPAHETPRARDVEKVEREKKNIFFFVCGFLVDVKGKQKIYSPRSSESTIDMRTHKLDITSKIKPNLFFPRCGLLYY
jgi:hypothetical protein